jgi:hypothetical protein
MSIIDVNAVMGGGGCGWASADLEVEAPGEDDAGGGGQGRAEQKGRLKWRMNLWRATLFGRRRGLGAKKSRKGWVKDGRTCAYSGGLLGWC